MAQVHHSPGDRIDAATLYQLLDLRCEVFVVEQACPYQDLDGRDLDAGTTHLWVTDHRGIAAAVRLLTEADGRRRIGRVVTRVDARGRGLASGLVATAVQRAGGAETLLSAQSHLRHFYEGLGYVVDGDEFDEDGIAHLPMRRPPGPGEDEPGGPG
jgi:ElaA protein